MDRRKKTDKVWLCESVGKIKGVGQPEKTKTNKLIIHTITDLQLHVNHHGTPKVHIRGFEIFMIWLFKLYRGTPLIIPRTTGKQKTRIFQDIERYGWTN